MPEQKYAPFYSLVAPKGRWSSFGAWWFCDEGVSRLWRSLVRFEIWLFSALIWSLGHHTGTFKGQSWLVSKYWLSRTLMLGEAWHPWEICSWHSREWSGSKLFWGECQMKNRLFYGHILAFGRDKSHASRPGRFSSSELDRTTHLSHSFKLFLICYEQWKSWSCPSRVWVDIEHFFVCKIHQLWLWFWSLRWMSSRCGLLAPFFWPPKTILWRKTRFVLPAQSWYLSVTRA